MIILDYDDNDDVSDGENDYDEEEEKEEEEEEEDPRHFDAVEVIFQLKHGVFFKRSSNKSSFKHSVSNRLVFKYGLNFLDIEWHRIELSSYGSFYMF